MSSAGGPSVVPSTFDYPPDFEITPVPASIHPKFSRDKVIALVRSGLPAGAKLYVQLGYLISPSMGLPQIDQAHQPEWIVTITGLPARPWEPAFPDELTPTDPNRRYTSISFQYYNAMTGRPDAGETISSPEK